MGHQTNIRQERSTASARHLRAKRSNDNVRLPRPHLSVQAKRLQPDPNGQQLGKRTDQDKSSLQRAPARIHTSRVSDLYYRQTAHHDHD